MIFREVLLTALREIKWGGIAVARVATKMYFLCQKIPTMQIYTRHNIWEKSGAGRMLKHKTEEISAP